MDFSRRWIVSDAAYHEAGHAIMASLAWHHAKPQPHRDTTLAVKYVAVTEEKPNCSSGICFGPMIYHNEVDRDHMARDCMEWQVLMYMAGGIAEVIHFRIGHKTGILKAVLRQNKTGVSKDRAGWNVVLGDLRKLTGSRPSAHRLAERAKQLLLENWAAVETLAEELMDTGRVEGERVEQIFNQHCRNACLHVDMS